jgi:hypothetical protein
MVFAEALPDTHANSTIANIDSRNRYANHPIFQILPTSCTRSRATMQPHCLPAVCLENVNMSTPLTLMTAANLVKDDASTMISLQCPVLQINRTRKHTRLAG